MNQIIEVEADICPKCELKEGALEEVKEQLSNLEKENLILRQKLIVYEGFNLASFCSQATAQLVIDPYTVNIIEPSPRCTSTKVYINPAIHTVTEDITIAQSPDSTPNFDSDTSGDTEPQLPTIKEELNVTPYPDTIYDFSNDICSYISANITRGVSSSTIQKCLATAHNEAHFAARLAQKMFSKEELSTSNITGRTSIPGRVINKLDLNRLELIKQAVCYAYKIEATSENMKNIWKKCKMSINEVCRRPRRSRVQLSNSPFKYVTTKGIKTPKKETLPLAYLPSQTGLAQVLYYATDEQIVPSATDYIPIHQDMSSYSPINLTAIKGENSVDQSPEPTN